MKMWSQGLGKIELEVDGRYMDVVKEDDDTMITGVTDAPVEWKFEVTLEKDDLPGLMHIAFKKNTLIFLLRNMPQAFGFFFGSMFKRKKLAEVSPK